MEIIIKDIPEEGLKLHFDSTVDEWFQKALVDSLGENYKREDHGNANFFLMRTGENVACDGAVSCDAYPTCSRCSKAFCHPLNIPIHLTLAPLYDNDRELTLESKEEVELVKEDLEFTFYDADRFDLAAVIREQIILELPMQPVCKEDCKGLCSTCGSDLNEGECGCEPKQADLRWAPLQKLKNKQ